MKYLFLCGMIRSGTTMLAKMFQSHRSCAVVWDVFVKYFLALAKNRGGLNQAISASERDAILASAIQCAEEYAPALVPGLGRIASPTWRALFEDIMACVREQCGDSKQTEVVGTKECWVDETAEELAGTFPNLHVIQIVRDPRAVVASMSKRNRYPLLFMVEYWRQSANLALYHRSIRKGWSDRYLLVRYEDLVSDPAGEATRMCRFLGIGYDAAMIQADRFRDGQGHIAPSNSSYGEHQEISTASLDRWKEILTPEEVGLIERLCAREMTALGYQLSQDRSPASLWSLYRYRDPEAELAPQYRNSPYLASSHRGLILLREFLRNTGVAGAALMPEALGRKIFWNKIELAGVASRGTR